MPAVTTLWTPHWHRSLFDCIAAAHRDVFLVSPWLKVAGAELILNGWLANPARPPTRLLTTLEEEDFVGQIRASDLEAYALLLSYGVEVRAVRGLHAKIYLFDDADAIVTSGDLTSRGLGRGGLYNLEVALQISGGDVVQSLRRDLTPIWDFATPIKSYSLRLLAQQIEPVAAHPQRTPTNAPVVPTSGGASLAQQSVGVKWWRNNEPSAPEHRLVLPLPVKELLASAMADPDLRQVFLSTRVARENAKSVSTERHEPSVSSGPLRGRTKGRKGNTGPTLAGLGINSLEDVQEWDDVLLDRIHRAVDQRCLRDSPEPQIALKHEPLGEHLVEFDRDAWIGPEFEEPAQWLRELAKIPLAECGTWARESPQERAFGEIVWFFLRTAGMGTVPASLVLDLLEDVHGTIGRFEYHELSAALRERNFDVRAIAEQIRSRRRSS